MSKTTLMNEFAKIFHVNEGEGMVLAYYEEDKKMGAFFTVIMTDIQGERFVTENRHTNEEEASTFINTFLQNEAEFFYRNTQEHGDGVPSFSLMFLLDLTYDEYCEWLEQQDPHNLKVMKLIMEKNPKFTDHLQVLEVYINKGVEKDDLK